MTAARCDRQPRGRLRRAPRIAQRCRQAESQVPPGRQLPRPPHRRAGHNASMEASVVVPQTAVWNVTYHAPPRLYPDVQQQPYALWVCAFPK